MKNGNRKQRRGIALVSILLVMGVMVILIAALVSTCTYNMRVTTGYRDKVASLEMARAGVSYVMARINKNLLYPQGESPDIRWPSADQDPNRYFEVTFDSTKPFCSGNNLSGTVSVKNYLGETVPVNTADLVVTGYVNHARTRVHVVFQGGIDTNMALTSMGRITLGRGCMVMGIKQLPSIDGSVAGFNDLLNCSDQLPGIIHSNYVAGEDNPETIEKEQHAISWGDAVTDADEVGNIPDDPEAIDPSFKGMYMGKTSMISCVSGESSDPIDPTIKKMLDDKYKDDCRYNERGTRVMMPEVDVNMLIDHAVKTQQVDENAYAQAPVSKTYDIPGSQCNYFKSNVSITAPTLIEGDYKINGDLTLSSDLYVKGNLEVTGAITGNGTVYVSNDTTFCGASSIKADIEDGTTIFCDGNVSMAGFDLEKFLADEAKNNTYFKNALGEYYENYNTLAKNVKSGGDAKAALDCMRKLTSVDFDNVNPPFQYPGIDSDGDGEIDSANTLCFTDRPDLVAGGGGTVVYNEEGSIIEGSSVQPSYPAKAILPQMIQYLQHKYPNRTQVYPPNQSNDKAGMAIKLLQEMCFNMRDGSRVTGVDGEGNQILGWDDETTSVQKVIPHAGEGDEIIVRGGSVENVSKNPSLQKYYYVQNENKPGILPADSKSFQDTTRDFLRHYPRCLSGGGMSYYQGIVYAKGNLDVNNQFRVIGLAMVKGNVKMKQGAQMIYDQEYTRFNASSLPLFRIASWEELK